MQETRKRNKMQDVGQGFPPEPMVLTEPEVSLANKREENQERRLKLADELCKPKGLPYIGGEFYE